jgi:hypothetical protein
VISVRYLHDFPAAKVIWLYFFLNKSFYMRRKRVHVDILTMFFLSTMVTFIYLKLNPVLHICFMLRYHIIIKCCRQTNISTLWQIDLLDSIHCVPGGHRVTTVAFHLLLSFVIVFASSQVLPIPFNVRYLLENADINFNCQEKI